MCSGIIITFADIPSGRTVYICEYCNKIATSVITRIMQPSMPHFACDDCKKKEGYMIIREEPQKL